MLVMPFIENKSPKNDNRAAMRTVRESFVVELWRAFFPPLPAACRLGLAWLGLAWLGLAWLGLAWLGLAWLGLAWLGLVWLGLAWLGLTPLSSLLFSSLLFSSLLVYKGFRGHLLSRRWRSYSRCSITTTPGSGGMPGKGAGTETHLSRRTRDGGGSSHRKGDLVELTTD